jgi:DNA-binding HxlR family transcriptional regulator
MTPWNASDPNCPTRLLLDRIADKWTVLIVGALSDGPLRFGEVKRAVGGVAPKVLTGVLRSLERDGMVARQVYPESPIRVEYRLTRLGRSLVVAVVGLRRWAERNMVSVLAARERA